MSPRHPQPAVAVPARPTAEKQLSGLLEAGGQMNKRLIIFNNRLKGASSMLTVVRRIDVGLAVVSSLHPPEWFFTTSLGMHFLCVLILVIEPCLFAYEQVSIPLHTYLKIITDQPLSSSSRYIKNHDTAAAGNASHYMLYSSNSY